MASSCWIASVRQVHVSCLRPDPGFYYGCCLEVEGVIVYELIRKKKGKLIMK